MLWAALPLPLASDDTPPSEAVLHGLACWALQFTPRVACRDEAVLLEAAASVRLFGGLTALQQRVDEARQLGAAAVAWAPTALGALALARAELDGEGAALADLSAPLAQRLDPLALPTLSAARPHLPVLARLGCRQLGALRRLPRDGVGRRFGQGLLHALDQAYGLRPEAHTWVALPETFEARVELPWRVEQAAALADAAQRLLGQLCGWLAARHAGTTAFTLSWCHDSLLRGREVAEGDALTVRTAQPTRDPQHLGRLLAEHLARVTLAAPVGALGLQAHEVQALVEHSASLLPDERQAGESLAQVLERLSVRLGPERVLRPLPCEDHRPEWMQTWRPATEPVPRAGADPVAPGLPQPTWLLPEPLPLALRGHRPMYQGVLHLLSGPHRVEGGWWQRLGEGPETRTGQVQRDYWVALSEHAGVLWVYQERLVGEHGRWFLHGLFA